MAEKQKRMLSRITGVMAQVGAMLAMARPAAPATSAEPAQRGPAPKKPPRIKTKAHPIFTRGWRPPPENDRQRRLRDELDSEEKRQHDRALNRARDNSGNVRGRFVPPTQRTGRDSQHKSVGHKVRALAEVHFSIIAAERDARRRKARGKARELSEAAE